MPADFPLTPGFRLNAQTIHRDLYRLTALLLSYPRLENASDELRGLGEQFVEEELSHLLAHIANANRMQRDHMRNLRDDPAELSFQAVEGDCGQWGWPTDPWKKPSPLSFKDACDKLIHAREIGMISFDPPSIYLRGERGGKEWEVKVDLLPYIELSVRNFANALS